ncbi:MAG: hypothetical protein H6707_00730 [Deltaproteobacteria bacterium]|nr:hypothetical protein [Deltaproteobacteria bacterium]
MRQRHHCLRQPFAVYLVANAWRGRATADAVHRYVADLFGNQPRQIAIGAGETILAGGAAHLVAYLGRRYRLKTPRPTYTVRPVAAVSVLDRRAR